MSNDNRCAVAFQKLATRGKETSMYLVSWFLSFNGTFGISKLLILKNLPVPLGMGMNPTDPGTLPGRALPAHSGKCRTYHWTARAVLHYFTAYILVGQ